MVQPNISYATKYKSILKYVHPGSLVRAFISKFNKEYAGRGEGEAEGSQLGHTSLLYAFEFLYFVPGSFM